MIDKNNVIQSITTEKKIVLELGCGSNKRHAEAIGIDALDYSCVDIVGDIYEVLAQFPSNSVDEVYSYHFIEHIENINKLVEELSRVVKLGGTIDFVVPHFSNPYFYSDPTHRNFFGLYTFCYFSAASQLKRKVPTHQKKLKFKLNKVDLGFKSSRPFLVRHAIKKSIGIIFNSSTYMKELYEEFFCYLFPY